MKERYSLFNSDCLEQMKSIPDKSVDMILCDLPYGTTACKWDVIIPFDKLWEQYERVIKDRGAIVLFGQEPFSSRLRLSNLNLYKYDWVWKKDKCGSFMSAKLKPRKTHENILVFSKGYTANGSQKNMNYSPQGLIPFNKIVRGLDKEARRNGRVWGKPTNKNKRIQKFSNYPETTLIFKSEPVAIHPTQKPVDLLEYLIKTYTQENEIVLDNTMGSGSTGVACLNTNRRFIGIEKDKNYFKIAKARIEQHLKKAV